MRHQTHRAIAPPETKKTHQMTRKKKRTYQKHGGNPQKTKSAKKQNQRQAR